jgi:hypothetical protein
MEYTDNTTGVSEPDAVGLSWQENELVGALKRLANAKSQLASLEAESAAVAAVPIVAPADVEALVANRVQLEAARAKSTARFGGSSARQRAEKLEANERLILDRVGMGEYNDFLAWRDGPPPAPPVDPAVLDFARREVRAATAAWIQIQSLEIPAVEAEPDEPAEAAPSHRVAHPEAS